MLKPTRPDRRSTKTSTSFARAFLSTHCVDCHGETDPEGNLPLEDLGPVDEVNSAIWKAVWAQVTLKEMPPKDADQPQSRRAAAVLGLDRR